MRSKGWMLTVGVGMAGIVACLILLIWTKASVTRDPFPLYVDLGFWLYAFFTGLILFILMILFVGAFATLYAWVKEKAGEVRMWCREAWSDWKEGEHES